MCVLPMHNIISHLLKRATNPGEQFKETKKNDQPFHSVKGTSSLSSHQQQAYDLSSIPAAPFRVI